MGLCTEDLETDLNGANRSHRKELSLAITIKLANSTQNPLKLDETSHCSEVSAVFTLVTVQDYPQ